MNTDDLKTLSQLGQALWAQPQHSERIAIETLIAVTLQELTPERALEKTSLALLRRAQRDGSFAIENAVHIPFYRLLPEERFVLMALHIGRWSYQRLARVLAQPAADVERLAWSARVHLSLCPGVAPVSHPTGSSGTSCPEYEADRPWTQRFMDEELPKREQIFVQNHLMACESCRQALARCRNLYYAVEKALPSAAGEDGRIERFEQALNRTEEVKRPSMSFSRSLEIFLSRRDIQLILAAGLVVLLIRLV